MRNILIVIKHEILTMLGKPSFWIMTFIFPVLILGLNVGMQAVAENVFEEETALGSAGASGAQLIGYVDEAGFIETIPPEMAPFFVALPDQGSAKVALEAGDLRQYYVVPADYVETGDLVVVDAEFSPLRNAEGSEIFEYIIDLNLVDDSDLASALINPTRSVEQFGLAPQQEPQLGGQLAFIIPYATMYILIFALTMSSGFMLQSVSKEKENRVAEVLLLSLRSRELMLGKVIGLGALALFQMGVWVGGASVFMGQGQDLIEGLSQVELPPGFLAWGLAYFVLGYLLYASVMGAIGALAPSARQGSQFTFIVILPLIVPLLFNSAFAQNPEGSLVTFFSLFPLSAPVSMVTRMAATYVPVWQPILGLLLLGGTTYLFVLLSARLFRADTLLSALALNWKRIARELRHKA
jgi:ABC-2 type transport system permease protein